MARLDSWSETALVTLNIQGVTGDFHMQCMTETIDIDWGEKGFESVATVCGGRITKFNPEEDTTITLEGYPLNAGFTEGSDISADGVMNLLYGAVTGDEDSMTLDSSRTRRKVRMVLRWTDATSANAEDLMVGTSQNLRMIFADGYVTSAKKAFTDGVLKVTLEAKFPPFDRSGAANFRIQSTDGTGATPADDIAALAAYTTSNKF
jgi:hypothetical protein